MTDSALELCHVFVLVERGAPEADTLALGGLVESFRRTHEGQGTANRSFCFDNAYLELIWIEDEDEARGPAIARTRLVERAAWRTAPASPLGIGVRVPPGGTLPFDSWDFRPPYVPEDRPIRIATESDDPRRPMVFQSPGTTRPDGWTDGRAGQRQAAAGMTEIAGLTLFLPEDLDPGPALEALERAGVLKLARTDGPLARLDLDLASTTGGGARRLLLPAFAWA